jgi:Family of unknown function (DUF6247)
MEPADVRPISRPGDLDLPPEVFNVLLNALTDEGRANFERDLLHAIQRAQQRNNLRPVREVLESWYRTLVVRQHPDYAASMAWARGSEDEDGKTVDDLMREIRQ